MMQGFFWSVSVGVDSGPALGQYRRSQFKMVGIALSSLLLFLSGLESALLALLLCQQGFGLMLAFRRDALHLGLRLPPTTLSI
jgi:hypothetical protein